MNKMHLSTRTIAYTAIMTALVAVATMVLKIQTGESYTNLGDTMIFLTALFFGPIPATIAGGLGSFIADLITYPLTMWFTLIIKSIEGLIAGLFVLIANKYLVSNIKKNIVNIVGLILAAAWMVFGYYICKAFMYGTPESALISLPKNCVQGGVSIILGYVLYCVLFPAVKKYVNKENLDNNN